MCNLNLRSRDESEQIANRFLMLRERHEILKLQNHPLQRK
jgi:hypothetical protein